jgi:hypothetical protein
VPPGASPPPAWLTIRIDTPPRFGQKRWQKFQLSFFTRKMNILAQFKKSPIITFSAKAASSHTLTRAPARGCGGAEVFVTMAPAA